MKNAYKILHENIKWREHLEDLRVDGDNMYFSES